MTMLMEPALYTVIGGAPEDRAAAAGRIGRWAAGSPTTDVRWINDVVRLRDTGELVGLCQATLSLSTDGAVDECLIGYLVDPDHHGRGIGHEMMIDFVDDLVADLSPPVIASHIAPGHTPSERIAAALGLSPTTAVDEDGERIWTMRSSEPSHRTDRLPD